MRPAYHNELHCYSTALTFHELALLEGLPLAEVRAGALAALYHDAAHQQAPEDDVNLTAAVAWLESEAKGLEEEALLTRVAKLILGTHNRRSEHGSPVEEVLHDADLLQTVKGTPEVNQQWQAWLQKESGKTVTEEGSFAYVEPRLLTRSGRALFERARSQAAAGEGAFGEA